MHFLVSEVKAAGTLLKEDTLNAESLLGAPPDGLRFNFPVQVLVKAEWIYDEVLVSGKTGTKITLACGRCLETFDRDLKTEFKQTFSTAEIDIDVTADIKESLFLDLPLYAVCRDDCRGLCPTCGKNKNMADCQCEASAANPAWDALKRYRFK